MAAQVIPRAHWPDFAYWFTQQHRLWRLTAHWQESPLAAVMIIDDRIPLPLRVPGRQNTGRTLVAGVCLSRMAIRLSPEQEDRVHVFLDDPRRRLRRLEMTSLSAVRLFVEEEGDRLELESRQGSLLTLVFSPARR